MKVEAIPTLLRSGQSAAGIYPVWARYDPMAPLVPDFPERRSRVLGMLFAAACPISCGGRDVLRPLWADEAMHRTSNMLQLVLILERRAWDGRAALDARREAALAKGLAASLRQLDIVHEEAMLPCSQPLRAIVCGLVNLFGPTVGRVSLKTELSRVELPAYKRRALVLAASELVTNALKHAFSEREIGRIGVSLSRIGDGEARLVVEDDGTGFGLSRPGAGHAIIAGLADLLEGELVYQRSGLGGLAAELRFPA